MKVQVDELDRVLGCGLKGGEDDVKSKKYPLSPKEIKEISFDISSEKK